MPRISVIIPVHNKAPYLVACLNSVLQSEEKEIEILCVNDHSTDHSLEILKSFEKTDARVKVIDMQKHFGVSWARNIGMSYAQGEYIAFVDADDLVSKSMYKNYYQYAKYYNLPIVMGHFQRFKDAEKIESNLREFITTTPSIIDYNKEEYRIYETSPGVWDKIYNHDFIKDSKFLEDHIYEDIAFTYPLLLKAGKVIEVPKTDYFYRITPNSITNPNNLVNPHILDLLDIYKEALSLGKKYLLSSYQMNLLKGRLKHDMYNRLWLIIENREISTGDTLELLSYILALFLKTDQEFLTSTLPYEDALNACTLDELKKYINPVLLNKEEELLKQDTLKRIRKINKKVDG